MSTARCSKKLGARRKATGKEGLHLRKGVLRCLDRYWFHWMARNEPSRRCQSPRALYAPPEDSLLLFQVVTPPVDDSGELAPVPIVTGEVVEEDMKRAVDYLAAVAARPPLTGIASTTE